MASSLNCEQLNTVSEETLREALMRCCGSTQWVEEMIQARPYRDWTTLVDIAEEIWYDLEEEDWLEAFSCHPKIGDTESLRQKFAQTADWCEGEQSGVEGASEETIQSLARLNQEYETKFGFIFIVCATGKTAEEMLQLLEERLPNNRPTEMGIAAIEQMKITTLRLQKWVTEEVPL